VKRDNANIERAYTKTSKSNVIPEGCGMNCHSFPFPLDRTECCSDGIRGAAAHNMLSDGRMPPLLGDSPYRWFNIDTPNGNGDYETLDNLKEAYPDLYCESPAAIEAHAVGSKVVFYTNPAFPDKLKTFNLRDGLECVNADQANGKCNNYQTSYLCNGVWTDPQDLDKPNKDSKDKSDSELRSKFKFPSGCTDPQGIQAVATYTIERGGKKRTVKLWRAGPNDRLSAFSNAKGLVCKNADQPSGSKCSNYVVRVTCP
jgi:hypothetical protein